MSLPRALSHVVSSVAEELRGSLPSSEATAGAWLAGFAWSFVLHWVMLVLVTWLWAVTR